MAHEFASHARAALALLLLLVIAFGRAQVSWGLPCGPAPTISEPTPEAREIYSTALDLVEKGRFAEALAAFERAYAASPSYVILYNVGKAAVLSGDPARALSIGQAARARVEERYDWAATLAPLAAILTGLVKATA